MKVLEKVLFLDLELDGRDRITDVGAVHGQRELHEKGTHELVRWIKEADFICGHNALAHDLPMLCKHLHDDPFTGKEVIDTLLWSPLLFPENAYHRLVKGYHLVNEDKPNDPLADSRLCREVLLDEVAKFEELDPALSGIYHGLLDGRNGFGGLFKLTGFHPKDTVPLKERIQRFFIDRICSHAGLDALIKDHPVELAYVLALCTTEKSNSILAEYVVREYPATKEILDQLRLVACGEPECSYCSTNLDPRANLKRLFDHDEFRLFMDEVKPGVQERAVRCALNGSSLLAVFPTGGGKSNAFQLPALMQGELTRDLTVVISPLVSLMKDQVDVLRIRHGLVNAAFISGLLSPLERDEAMQKVKDGDVHLLYIAPESLRSPSIFNLLQGRAIARFVIDEAHCFSSWGQDFRVEYLFIADYIKDLQRAKGAKDPVPVSCFTATAKPAVIEDIQRYFKERMDVDLELFVSRAVRENLSYEIIPVDEPDQKLPKLVELLRENASPAIVYVSRTKRVGELVEYLGKNGIRATGFHGKMDREEKQRNQKAFMTDEVTVMIATSAFGMGVDKEDVRTVVHFNISDSLEGYIQEAGRAGRRSDIQAKCFALFHESDLANHFRLHQSSKLNQKQIEQVWQTIKNLTKLRENFSKSALEIARYAGWDMEMRDLETKVKAALAALEDCGYVARKLNYTTVNATSIRIRDVNKARNHIEASDRLTEAQRSDCIRMMQRVVKDKDREGETRIDYLADALEMNVRKAQETIDLLRELGILADGKDLTAILDHSPISERSARKRARRVMPLEKELLKLFVQEPFTATLKGLNRQLQDKGVKGSSIELIHDLLLFWEMRGILSKKRLKRQEELYRITLKKPKGELLEQMEIRHTVAAACLGYLETLAQGTPGAVDSKLITFSLLELQRQLEFQLVKVEKGMGNVESALLFLNQLKVIQLEGGFMMYYQRLHIARLEKNNSKQFTQEDYAKLRRFYENKVQQIHFVGEYAKKRIASYTDALAFVDDYFKRPYAEFVRKYFPSAERRVEITRTMTATRFKELFGQLSLVQKEIVADKGNHILVSAGPGSGKTRVLVHKIASVLLMEDVKPEQFLMLTFSRSAALEFRARVHKLVPEYKGAIKITTFHGFCFDLLGEIGDLERSEEVVGKAIAALEDKDVDLPGVLNKSVLVLDEFQDVTSGEWRLIKELTAKVPGLRIIAVGDDDQNIFDWRPGASNDHWSAFTKEFDPKHYTLLKNYRSAKNIVAFNEHFVEPISGRAKAGQHLEADSHDDGTINVVEHASLFMAEPIVSDVLQYMGNGSMAVLARTNEDVLLLTAALSQAGVKVRSVHGAEGFQLDMLHEVRQFTAMLESVCSSLGSISKQVWQRSKDHFLQQLEEHPLQADLLEIIAYFELNYPGRIELGTWKEFTRELRMEEAVRTTPEVVLVTTMHKSKAKEFDTVIVLLKDEQLHKDGDRRLAYVACTRARKNLIVHTNTQALKGFEASTSQYLVDTTSYPAPMMLEYVVGMKEVYLDTMKPAQAEIKRVASGSPLQAGDTFRPDGTTVVLKFSSKMKEGPIARFKKAGYTCTDATVEYKVHWYDKEDDREYEVVLPRLRFKKAE
ncbi:MAG: RecQ family ATP-dependent DNA helicase [Flavobacteriales bacterium]